MNIRHTVSDTQALRDLLEKVDAGEASTMGFEDAGFDGWAELAYFGSLDAAKALHDAVLPGWDLQICTYEDDLFEVSVSKPTSVTTHDGLSEIISRAWLICILRALIAQATP